ncbi:hypothetical protein KXX34_004736 [Aspergillus fumigatus]|nr:hypothetical protein KXX34_004736 [Aspergillus fumigatus]
MTTAQPVAPQTELVTPAYKPQEISFPLPKALHTTAHVHLTILETCVTIFLATTTPGEPGGSLKPMGSFIYAMPDRHSPRSVISTVLYSSPSTEEYTSRVAKILARRMSLPVYVGCSIDPRALELAVEEEMEGLRNFRGVVFRSAEQARQRTENGSAVTAFGTTTLDNFNIHSQVQDLEKQLSSTKQQLQQLRAGMLRSDNLMDLEIDGTGQPQLKLPDIGYRPSRRPKAPVLQDLSEARVNLRKYGRGILKVPSPYRQPGPKSLLTADPPRLPPKDVANHLLAQYYSCIHCVLPIIHWPSFMVEYENVYRNGSLVGVPREWAAVLFGVFACGSLHTLDRNREEEGKEFIKTSCGVIDVWQDNFTLDQARCALLVSIFLYEVNSKSASWVWIGSAVRIAQELGLHIESGPWPVVEREMRRRVWWGMYAWDRLLALEMGKPVLINDQDCDVDLPCPFDEQYIAEGACVPEGQQTTPLLATIHVVRSIGQLTRTLRSYSVSTGTLETFERHFSACLATFPPQYHPKSDLPLDPRSLAPIGYLQNARLILHRHNISPFCSPDVRSAALDYSISIAKDTAHLLSRCMRYASSTGNDDWRPLFASSAGTMLCTHIWRCSLLLLFRQEFAAALVCVQASAVVGDSHTVNAACGRYIAFFLRCLLERLRRGDAAILERDEEMMAYVSGDMQGTSDGSWVWEGSETGSQLEAMSPKYDSPASFTHAVARNGWPHGEGSEIAWEGWEWVERTVEYLLKEKQQQQQQQQQEYERRDVPLAAKPTEPALLKTEQTEPAPAKEMNSVQSRMTIASII